MADKIIKKETKQGTGIYLIEVDKEKSSKVIGSNHAERVKNAIQDFLTPNTSIGYKLRGNK